MCFVLRSAGRSGCPGIPRFALGGILAVVAVTALPLPGAAQVVRGTVVDPSTTGPVEGAMVVLLDEGDRRRGAVLTDATGSFRLAAPGPGTYRLRADRIGYRSARTASFELAGPDTVFHTVESRMEAIPLAGIEVEGRGRCRVRPEEGMATARAWEEARKALAAAEWTDEMGVYRYRIASFVRTVDPWGRELASADSTFEEELLRIPFRAAPAERLVADGFVRRQGADLVYFGPDAAVLLSDVFLDTHCMGLRRGEGEARGLLGLAFEPVEDRGVADVRGTLWLDPESSELRRLDYEYVELEHLGVRSGDAGGRVVFEGLPNGAWIIRRWEIRMPLVGERHRGRSRAYRVEGARVLQVRDGPGPAVPAAGGPPGGVR